MHVPRLSGDSLQLVEQRAPATVEITRDRAVDHRETVPSLISIQGLPPIVQEGALPEVPRLRVVSHCRSSGDHHQPVTGVGRDEYTPKGVPMAQHQVTDKKLDQLMDRLPISPETRPAPTEIRSFLPYAPAQLVEREKTLTIQLEQAAIQAAPASWTLQLARELSAIRIARLISEASINEAGALSEAAVERMAKFSIWTQIVLDGLRGKVDDDAFVRVREARSVGLEAMSLIHASGQEALIDQTGSALARLGETCDPTVRPRDLVVSYLLDRTPNKKRMLRG